MSKLQLAKVGALFETPCIMEYSVSPVVLTRIFQLFVVINVCIKRNILRLSLPRCYKLKLSLNESRIRSKPIYCLLSDNLGLSKWIKVVNRPTAG